MKRGCLLFAFAWISTAGFCQVQVGIKGGYSWFTILQSDDYRVTSVSYDRNSFPVAIYVSQRSPQLVNFHLEAEYLRRGYTMQEYWGGLGTQGQASFEIDAGYLSLLLEPRFVFGKKFRFFIFPGLYAGIPVWSSATGSATFPVQPYPHYETQTISGSAKGYIQAVEFGALAGVGIDIPVYRAFNITVQYAFSISLIPLKSKWGDNTYRFMQNKIEAGIAYTL